MASVEQRSVAVEPAATEEGPRPVLLNPRSYDPADFDEATRDPGHPTRFLPQYESGDHLHPSDAGYRAMADAIDLALFKAAPTVTRTSGR